MTPSGNTSNAVATPSSLRYFFNRNLPKAKLKLVVKVKLRLDSLRWGVRSVEVHGDIIATRPIGVRQNNLKRTVRRYARRPHRLGSSRKGGSTVRLSSGTHQFDYGAAKVSAGSLSVSIPTRSETT